MMLKQSSPKQMKSQTGSQLPPLACRDTLFLGDADDGVQELCELLGWSQELQALIDAV